MQREALILRRLSQPMILTQSQSWMKDMVKSSSITTIGGYNLMGRTVLDENRFPLDHVTTKSWVSKATLQNSILSMNKVTKL